MNIGISTAALFPEKNTEEALKTINSLKIPLAEIFLSTFYEYRVEYAARIAENLNGLYVNSLHAMGVNFEPNLFNPTRRVKGDGLYWLDQIARSAQLLKCNSYTFHGFHRGKGGGEDDYGFIAACMDEACRFLNGYGVSLCLENVSWCMYNRPGFFTEIKNRCPALSAVFDIKQARRSGYPYQMYIKDMSGAIAYAHLSDVDENGKMCLPGKGIYDFKEIISRLKDEGFDGNIIVEVYRGDYEKPEELKQSCEYLREIVYKLS